MTEHPDLDLNKGSAAAALTPPGRRLHHAVLAAFVRTGRAPLRAELQRDVRDRVRDPDAALSELIGLDLLAVDDHGEIRAAYPFSPTPTRHVVTWPGGPTAWAMCAIDALGISAMLDRPVTVTSAEPDSGAAITVEVHRDRARWNPDTAVVLAAATGDACCPSVDRTCGHINFFTSANAAHRWAATHPRVTATLLGHEQAVACAIAEFANLLRPERHTPRRI